MNTAITTSSIVAVAGTEPTDDDAARVSWLARRAGFGLHPDDARRMAADGVDDALDRLLDTSAEPADPWDGVDLDPQRDGRANAVRAWLAHVLASDTPYVDRRTLMLHGWLVSAMDKVIPEGMADQLRLLMRDGGGPFDELLRSITVDRGMLQYLDGRTSTAAAPNENYARELLELFALGLGESPDGSEQPYGEHDVLAAARALTGWVVTRRDPAARFVPSRHDDTPQTLLGVDGVHDVDSVIDAVVAHPEHARFVARRITSQFVGDPTLPAMSGVVDLLAEVYERNERRIDAVVRAALELTLAGTSSPIVTAPIPWLLGAMTTLGVPAMRLDRRGGEVIREMGQVPLFPPSVEGWPHGTEWFTTSSLIARSNAAAGMAELADPGHPIVTALDDRDLDAVAVGLGLVEPLTTTTADAVRAATSPTAALTLALISPEYLLS